MDRIGSQEAYSGKVVSVRIDSFRDSEGSVREREIVAHPGAVAVLAHDDERLFMVRQPREAVLADALLELPAGKLDVEGETPLECARRELEEEVGIRASEWRHLKTCYSSPGFTDEQVHVFEATELEKGEPDPDDDERIEIVEVALADLDRVIEECADAKSIIGLLLLRARLNS